MKQKDMGGMQEGDTSLWMIFCFWENILRMPVLRCHFSRHKLCILEVKGSTILLHFSLLVGLEYLVFVQRFIGIFIKTSHQQN